MKALLQSLLARYELRPLRWIQPTLDVEQTTQPMACIDLVLLAPLSHLTQLLAPIFRPLHGSFERHLLVRVSLQSPVIVVREEGSIKLGLRHCPLPSGIPRYQPC